MNKQKNNTRIIFASILLAFLLLLSEGFSFSNSEYQTYSYKTINYNGCGFQTYIIQNNPKNKFLIPITKFKQNLNHNEPCLKLKTNFPSSIFRQAPLQKTNFISCYKKKPNDNNLICIKKDFSKKTTISPRIKKYSYKSMFSYELN